ncbi:hypothetical protein Dsin_000689 [Dipteronia sinensis]|uniref:Uncharacterized protein n=1 Tax=Dipteronia sinensis TaxID=43782 RepID=A0AAE0B2I5_9ROSI|nr:hypothetical protein Dsin_000689 [Dipteronia sinensis]
MSVSCLVARGQKTQNCKRAWSPIGHSQCSSTKEHLVANPTIFISAIADVFAIVGLQELFYDHQVLELIRSLGSCSLYKRNRSTAIITIVQAISSRICDHEVWLEDETALEEIK